MCGGTTLTKSAGTAASGLSPRVRGNPRPVVIVALALRSIPACAGEPNRAPTKRSSVQVYPRVCGGTLRWSLMTLYDTGLSPRVRGNLNFTADARQLLGSIPACAGEPRLPEHQDGISQVYPRVCGGTQIPPTAGTPAWGLSPRVRGNPARQKAGTAAVGSIPACAGEPQWRRQWPAGIRVYPRVCGGTCACVATG